MVAVQYSPRCETPRSIDQRTDAIGYRTGSLENAPEFPLRDPKCRHALLPEDALKCFPAEILYNAPSTAAGERVEGVADRLVNDCALAKQRAVPKRMATDRSRPIISLPR